MSNPKKNVRTITLREIKPPKIESEEFNNISEEVESITLQTKIEKLKQELTQLEEQKEQLLQQLKQQIDEEKQVWAEQKEIEKQQSQEDGYRSGFEQGKQEVFNQYQTLLEQANEIVTLANEDYHRTVKKYEEAIVRLAIRSAEKIIHEKLLEDPNRFVTIIEKAIEDLQDRAQITVYVNPHDYPHVINQKEELEQLIEEDDLLSIYNQPNLQQGSCTIEHPFGQLDISIDAQLSELKHALAQFVMENG